MRKYLWGIPFFFLAAWGIADFINLGGFLVTVSDADNVAGTPSYTAILLDATGEKYGVAFPVVGTLTFRRFGFKTGAITTGTTLDVRLETAGQGQATGMPPSGTLACANSSTTLVLAAGDANSYKESANLASDCTVTNTTVAVVVNNVNGTFNGNFNFFSIAREDYNVIYSSNSSAGWAALNGTPFLTIVDSNSNYINLLGMMTISSITTTAMTSATNPNTRGNVINFPFDHRIIGVKYTTALTEPLILKLWDTNGATVLESVFISSATSVTASRRGYVTFSKGYRMSANKAYRLTFTPVTGTSSNLYHYSWPSQTIMNNLVSMGPYVYLSTGNNPTQESNWTQSTLERVPLYPVIDQIGITPGQDIFYDSTIYDAIIQ